MYGDFIRAVRVSRHLSQSDLAATLDMSQPNLSAYERDHRVPTADTLNKILVACGYQLAAVAGEQVVFCPLPRSGWYPDEDVHEPGDPPDERPVLGPEASVEEHATVLLAVLELAEATR
ncbi:MAG: hypothetical protein NVSMB4_21730 [Acidimicrobiales bacterium]